MGDKRSLELSGGVRTSSFIGDTVETDVKDVGRSISELIGISSSGLVGKLPRYPVGKIRWLRYLLGLAL
jgi:hypothetical protein